jgi:hypothetical protein
VSITTPDWVFWLIGIPIALAVLGMVILGVLFLVHGRDFGHVMARWFGW